MIFVTGGCGFIGSNFLHHLLNVTDEEIVCIDKLTYAANWNYHPDDVSFYKVDISDKTALTDAFLKYKPTKIFHFAAETHVDNSIKNVMPFLQSNIIGTINLLQLSIEHEVEMFHHISTDEVYGALSYDDKSFTEDTPYNPQNPYSASKASSDHFVMAFHNTYGIPVKITNCSNNYGPSQHEEKLIPKIIKNVIAGEKIPVYGNGQHMRDWIYVEDHCEAIYEVFLKGKVGEKYNIGGECEVKNIDLVNMILDIMDGDKSLVQFVSDRPGHDLRYSIDNDKIRNELHWSPKTSLLSGLEKTIQWYNDIYSS
jgi:dTDP-glucose 4,6-dehydratase